MNLEEMNDEAKQDHVIAYVLGELSAGKTAAFELELRRDPELAEEVRALRESTALFIEAVPSAEPARELRTKVLVDFAAGHRVAGAGKKRKLHFRKWTLPPASELLAFAACLILIVGFACDDLSVRGKADRVRADTTLIRNQLSAFDRRVADLTKQNEEQQRQIVELENRNSLAQVKIADLSAQTEPLVKANVVVVWDAQKQEGLIKLIHVPKPDAGKDYQLWVIDSHYANPVSAGLLSVGDDGSVVISFKPTQPITTPDKFAISVENAGGAPQPAGPIIFAGS